VCCHLCRHFHLYSFYFHIHFFSFFFFFYTSGHHRDLHSFPTRRSSDLGSECLHVGRRQRLAADPPVPGLDLFHGDPRHRAHVLRSEEHTSELQSLAYLVCRLLLEKKKHTPIS